MVKSDNKSVEGKGFVKRVDNIAEKLNRYIRGGRGRPTAEVSKQKNRLLFEFSRMTPMMLMNLVGYIWNVDNEEDLNKPDMLRHRMSLQKELVLRGLPTQTVVATTNLDRGNEYRDMSDAELRGELSKIQKELGRGKVVNIVQGA